MADEVSRGISVKNLADRWQKGPSFLRLAESEWPQDATAADQREVEREQRAVQGKQGTATPRLQKVFELEKTGSCDSVYFKICLEHSRTLA